MEKKPQKVKSADVILITSDRLGTGDEELGKILMKSFLNTLWDYKTKPSKVIFINIGVMLTTEGSEVLETLEFLEKEGVEILSCGTCLAFYGIKEKLRVGNATNMPYIVDSLLTASKVITI